MRLHGYIVAGTTLLATAAFGQATAPVQYLSIKPDSMLTSKLVGVDVYNQKNEKIGEIADVVIERGSLEGYVLSIGGFLGMGERYVAVQPSSVSIKYDESANQWRATANASKDQLKSAPEFKYHSKWKG
jgi:sporulation protein YlmC with PRC-barrel domain